MLPLTRHFLLSLIFLKYFLGDGLAKIIFHAFIFFAPNWDNLSNLLTCRLIQVLVLIKPALNLSIPLDKFPYIFHFTVISLLHTSNNRSVKFSGPRGIISELKQLFYSIVEDFIDAFSSSSNEDDKSFERSLEYLIEQLFRYLKIKFQNEGNFLD
jgi:hypothetical protein